MAIGTGLDFEGKVVLVTGGACFIGCNAAARFTSRGHEVLSADNLSRVGSETAILTRHVSNCSTRTPGSTS